MFTKASRNLDHEFAVITCYFNPCGFQNRKLAFTRFTEGLARQNVSLWTIEASLPGTESFIAESERSVRVQLPRHDWLWQKERLINLLVKQLPTEITKVAWIDCDLLFENDSWATLACEALDTWPVIQLFDFVYWLGPDDEILPWEGITDRRASLASIAMHYPDRAQNFRIGSPGFAWAAKRSLLETHGLYENDITGGGDSMIASALYGWMNHGFLTGGTKAMIHDGRNYIRAMHDDVRGYVGYIPCSIRHLWHGSYENRDYVGRRRRLGELGFDPFRDLEHDRETGLLRWSHHANDELKKYLRNYFYSRDEDASSAR